ncbi:MAG: 2-amino-4-hydroxy-6-hydroxymethyldihydropteridine diphosphokinase [Gammaproteobacteria bacterium]|jgi:2-amino-4-hydroxy-6-hydroxymethyldihydropteridine diphosphokinase
MASEYVAAWVGLGSNLDDPQAQILRALEELDELPETRRVKASGLYRNPPMGPQDQPDYVNAVARLETALTPLALLDALLAIEQAHGRIRALHWGPRTLDLDLLLYGDQVLDHERLRLPHPGLHERAFVLYPLLEIDPGLEIPGLGRLRDLAAACPADGLIRISASL